MGERIGHLAICACRPQLSAVPLLPSLPPHIPRVRGRSNQLLLWGCTTGRGPGDTRYSRSRLGPIKNRNPTGSRSVSARLRLSSAVFDSHNVSGVIDDASVDTPSPSSSPSRPSLGSGLLPAFRERALRVFLTLSARFTGAKG
jgi:hypothetical protein